MTIFVSCDHLQKAEGPAAITKKASTIKTVCAIEDGKFSDYRWVNGTWNFAEFSDGKGGTDWDAVTPFPFQSMVKMERIRLHSTYSFTDSMLFPSLCKFALVLQSSRRLFLVPLNPFLLDGDHSQILSRAVKQRIHTLALENGNAIKTWRLR